MRGLFIKKISLELYHEKVSCFDNEEQENNAQKINYLKNILKKIIINDLTSRQKQVCLLYFYEKKNIPQIARMLNLNKSTVSRTLARSIRNINDKIKYYNLR